MIAKPVLLVAIVLVLPLAHAFAVSEGNGGPAAAAAPKSQPLLDEKRLTPVDLPDPVDIRLPADTEAAIAEVAAAVAAAAGLPSENFRLSKQEKDTLGYWHIRFDQVEPYPGGAARVLGGDLIAHVKEGQLVSISGNVALGINAELPPTVGKAAARRNQQAHVRGRSPSFSGANLLNTELLVIPSATSDIVAWCSEADLTEDTDSAGFATPALLRVCSAGRGNGQVIESRDELRTTVLYGTGRSFFNGNVDIETVAIRGGFRLIAQQTAGNSETVNMNGRTNKMYAFTDADNIWGNNQMSDTATVAVDAHWGAMKAFKYFNDVHGRNGIENNGVGALSRVHYASRYNNAFWSDRCLCMTYGDGDGTTFNPFTALDVTGHEMAHGVTSRTANLAYYGESGGLNEATSDIFGTLVEFFADSVGDTPDYLIGEELYKSGGQAMRYMHNPELDGRSRNCYSSTLGSLDVHFSSGVANHFFFLLAEGSNSTNPGFPVSPVCSGGAVVGIGRDQAGKIWYRALTTYMVSSTNYAGARTATLKAANDLYPPPIGSPSPSTEYEAVKAAWTAVGVN